MNPESFEDFQYDSCISRGICSVSPRTSALQTVLVLYLRLFAKYAIEIPSEKIPENFKDLVLNTLAITVFNTDLNEDSFNATVKNFREILPQLMEIYSELNPEHDIDAEKSKPLEIFRETGDINRAIRFGEKIFRRGQENISADVRDLYTIMLVICNSLSINLLDLKSYDKNYNDAFITILNLLGEINLEEKNIEVLKNYIYKSSETYKNLMKILFETQEARYGKMQSTEVSYSTKPNKAVLVVGSNIRELETVLEELKNEDIDIYTHDEMMFAHTFPKFNEYENLKGQFGQGLENCLIDFATFPGPIILTKHSLHNIQNLYRGRLFTTDLTCPKGVIKIKNNDFSEVIKSANDAKGFKTGKECESVIIGYDLENIVNTIESKLKNENYNHLFFIGQERYTLEQNAYFEKIIKHAPKNVLIISFSYNIEQENLIHINACFDSFSLIKFVERVRQNCQINTTVFFPKCDRNSVSEMIYLSHLENVEVYVGKCTPIIPNPTLITTLNTLFGIKNITTAKKDLEIITKK